MRTALIASVCLLSMATLTGCGSGGGDDQKISGIGGITPMASDGSGKSAPIYVEPTMDVLKGKEQPFPARYPLKPYPKAKVALAWVRPNLNPGDKNQVMLKTDDAPAVVSQFYNRDLAAEGWKLVSRYQNEVYSSTIWQKGDQECEVRVSPDPKDKNNIQLLTGPIVKRKPAPGVDNTIRETPPPSDQRAGH